MADCLAQVWTDPTDYGWCCVSPDGASIVGRAPNNNFYVLDVATYTTDGVSIIDRSAIAAVGSPAIASDSLIYWIETADFSVYRLMSANLDGSSVTTVLSPISFSPSLSFSFEVPNLAYDGTRDEFWITSSPGGGRLATMTKAGVVTNRYSPPSSSTRYHHPLVDADGGVWSRWGGDVYRTDNSTFATVSATDLFGNAFPAVSLDLSGNGIVEDGGTTDSYYSFDGAAVTETRPSSCTIASYAFGFTPAFWTPDYAGVWYYEPGSSSPVINAYLWGQFAPGHEIPPLRLYARDDGKSVAMARQNITATSILASPRIRQGAGYL